MLALVVVFAGLAAFSPYASQAYATNYPPQVACTQQGTEADGLVEATADDNAALKRGLRANLIVQTVGGNECLRINSIEMVNSIANPYPQVEFGWSIGWDPCSRSTYYGVPRTFMARFTDFLHPSCNDTVHVDTLTGGGQNYWFKILGNSDGTWTTYLDNVVKWTTVDLGTSHMRPWFMNAERHYWAMCPAPPNDGGCEGNTLNGGNFKSIEEEYFSTWQAVDGAHCQYNLLNPDDPDFACHAIDAEHYRSCPKVGGCT